MIKTLTKAIQHMQSATSSVADYFTQHKNVTYITKRGVEWLTSYVIRRKPYGYAANSLLEIKLHLLSRGFSYSQIRSAIKADKLNEQIVNKQRLHL